LQRKRRD